MEDETGTARDSNAEHLRFLEVLPLLKQKDPRVYTPAKPLFDIAADAAGLKLALTAQPEKKYTLKDFDVSLPANSSVNAFSVLPGDKRNRSNCPPSHMLRSREPSRKPFLTLPVLFIY